MNITKQERDCYENGPEGMPRVERMTRNTIMAVLSQKNVPTIYVSREEDYNSLCKFAHAVAEETLARVPAWPQHSLSAQDEVLTDEKISAIYEQSQGMTLRDRDFQGVAAFARALLEATPVATNPDNAIREAILQYYDDLSARKHSGMAQDKAFQVIQDALGMSWECGADHRAKYATTPSLAVRDVVDEVNEREAFEAMVKDRFVTTEFSLARAHPYGYYNSVSSNTYGGRSLPEYANMQMLWDVWDARAHLKMKG